MSYRAAHLSDIAPVVEPEPHEQEWRPVRAHLGIQAFGVNAWIGREAGDRVLEEHTETTTKHEELYLVVSGRARFELDGETLDGPRGTFVFVDNPRVRRTAFAEEPGTTILAVGARRGEVFQPSAWELRYTA